MAGVLNRFAIAAIPPSRWKNGGGETRELARWPPGAGYDAFDWRVSIARIGVDGPFSRLPGVDRVISLLDGDGVHLHGDGIDHVLDTPFAPFAFSGDTAVEATRLGGASSDFNAMSRHGRLTCDLRVVRGPATLPPAPHGLVLAWRAAWYVCDILLSEGEGIWWADDFRGTDLRPHAADAVLLAAVWQPIG